jgi:hypothetical protein
MNIIVFCLLVGFFTSPSVGEKKFMQHNLDHRQNPSYKRKQKGRQEIE